MYIVEGKKGHTFAYNAIGQDIYTAAMQLGFEHRQYLKLNRPQPKLP
jgi:hypothetical protein